MSSTKRKLPASPGRYKTLAAWRRDRGFTLQQAADFLDVSLTSYFNMERGDRHPRPETMKRVLERTGVAIEFLAGVA